MCVCVHFDPNMLHFLILFLIASHTHTHTHTHTQIYNEIIMNNLTFILLIHQITFLSEH